MTKRKLTFVIFIVLIHLFTTLALASEDITFKKYLDKANSYIKTYRHFEASDALKKATELGGAQHPSLHMRLGILYYGLGLIPEAIAEGEKAVALAPSSKWYKYDLAKFYFVDKQFDKAEQQVIALLRLDPGFTLGYYYLADLYFKKKAYDMAWLSLQRARRLGFKSRQLEEKLDPFSSKPAEDFEPSQNDRALFRFITLSTSAEAKETLSEIRTGKLFENIELELKNGKSSENDFGVMMLNELQDEVADSLRNNQPYSPPLIIRTGAEYRIIQRIMPFDRKSWVGIISVAPKTIQNDPTHLVATAPPTAADNDDNSFMVLADTSKPEALRNTTLPNDTGPKQLLSSKLAALYAVENWKMAWTEQNVEEYLTAYSDTFTPPDGSNLETWEKKRHRSLTKTSFIHIDIKDLVVETLNEKQLQVTFKQSYESDNYQDVVFKRLTMRKETKGWKIIEEKVIQKLTP